MPNPGTFFILAFCRLLWYYACGAAITVGGQSLRLGGQLLTLRVLFFFPLHNTYEEGLRYDNDGDINALPCFYQLRTVDYQHMQKEVTATPAQG